MALNIGLAIRYKLSKFFNEKNTKIDLLIYPGFHRLENESKFFFIFLVNKQLNDKERYLAAF